MGPCKSHCKSATCSHCKLNIQNLYRFTGSRSASYLSLSLRNLASQSLSTNPSNLRRSDVAVFISSRNCSLRLRMYVGSYITNKLTDDRIGSFIYYMLCVTLQKILHKISCKTKVQKWSIQTSQTKFQYSWLVNWTKDLESYTNQQMQRIKHNLWHV